MAIYWRDEVLNARIVAMLRKEFALTKSQVDMIAEDGWELEGEFGGGRLSVTLTKRLSKSGAESILREVSAS